MILAIRHWQSGVLQVWAKIQTGGAPASSKTPSSRIDDPGMAREDWMGSGFMQDAPGGIKQRCRQFIRSAPAFLFGVRLGLRRLGAWSIYIRPTMSSVNS